MRLEATTVGVSVRRRASVRFLRWLIALVGLALVVAALVGLVFAGSPARLAEGVTIAGVDVGGMTRADARRLLERRAAALAAVPVVFTAAGESFPIEPRQLGVEADWAGAVAAATEESDGFGPVRGYRRLRARFFGEDVTPALRVFESALDYKLGMLASDIDREDVEAKLVRRGLQIEVVRGQTGVKLDREASEQVIVRALASLERAGPVALPVRTDPIEVTAAQLAPAAEQARIALSAPVRLAHGETRWRLPRWRIAELLQLPGPGELELEIAGPKAEAWFERLQKTVGREPVDATFAVEGDTISIVPAEPGLGVDVARTAENLLAAAVRPQSRVAQLAVVETQPDRTTEQAQAMGIERRLASYSTAYAGDFNRITNLQLGVTALDGTLVAPGGTFSFNEVVGERTAERGYRSAPVIYEGEYQEDVGGGVSQVATTVFNAAWEAGLKITERNPHLFYISRYQLGRDATVNYPDLDLKFVNDTEKWVLVTGGYGGGQITVSLYGGGEPRRVESEPGPLRVTGPAPVKRVKDPKLEKGSTVIEEPGSPSYATTVTRTVYSADGDVLAEETWNTSYRGETKVIRVGTKPKPREQPAKDPKPGDPVTTGEAPPPEAVPPPPRP